MSIQISPQPPPRNPSPEEALQREGLQNLADYLANLLDTIIHIPGTNIRIGLDPLIGLIPAIGDLIANAIGSTLIFLASQLGVPKIVLVRMTLNMGINTVIGAVPVIGDLFSVWFKSNVRNAHLLRSYSQGKKSGSTLSDWAFVIGLLLTALLVLVGCLWALIWIIAKMWTMVG